MLDTLLQPHRIILNSHSETWQQVLLEIGSTFRTPAEVTDAFVDALLEREENYPTGLPVSPVAVALPHADGVYVRKAGLGLCTLSRPVPFHQMGSPELTVSVRLVICIALPEEKRDEQAVLLGQLIDRIQSEELVQRVLNARTVKDAARAFGAI